MGHWNRQELKKDTLVVKPKELSSFPSLRVEFAPYVEYSVDTLRLEPDGLWFGFKRYSNDKDPFLEFPAERWIIVKDDR